MELSELVAIIKILQMIQIQSDGKEQQMQNQVYIEPVQRDNLNEDVNDNDKDPNVA